MPHFVPPCVRPALAASAAILLTSLLGCTAPRNLPLRHVSPDIDLAAVLNAETAAARAIAVSPRVLAAAHRLDASASRANAAALPPDPMLAVSLGVPVDGLGGFPVSVSIMEGLTWLLRADQIKSAAERERTAAAAELTVASIEVAAEARRLVRALAATREHVAARERAAEARADRLAIEKAAQQIGESNAARIAAHESLLAQARLEAEGARLSEHELATALASLLSLSRAPAVDGATPALARPSPSITLDVIRARARVTRAESMLATSAGPLGMNASLGPNYSRDIEDRESLGGTIEFGAPIFRRSHEIAALEADLAAERAELAEAERRAALDLDHATAQIDAARAALAIALEAAHAAGTARAALTRAATDGEASRAEVADATAEVEEWTARATERRIELVNTLFKIESRATPSAGTQE